MSENIKEPVSTGKENILKAIAAYNLACETNKEEVDRHGKAAFLKAIGGSQHLEEKG